MGNYKGKYQLNYHDEPGFAIKAKVKPRDIYLFTRIFEGYSHLGFAIPLDAANGIVVVYTTPENNTQIVSVLRNLPIDCEIIWGEMEKN